LLLERTQDQTSKGANRRRCTEETRVRGHAAEGRGVLVMNFATEQAPSPRVELRGRDTVQEISRRTVEKRLVSIAAGRQIPELLVERSTSGRLERKSQQHETGIRVHRRSSRLSIETGAADGCAESVTPTRALEQSEVCRQPG